MAEATLRKTDDQNLTSAEGQRGQTVTPRVDILETDGELVLRADLPGVKEDDVDIRVEKGELTLRARRVVSRRPGLVLQEAAAGDYFRAFRVSEQIDAAKVSAELKAGVLTLRLPKVEAVKPRRIAVKGA